MAERFVGSNRVAWFARSLSKAGIPILEFDDGSCSKRRVARSFCNVSGHSFLKGSGGEARKAQDLVKLKRV